MRMGECIVGAEARLRPVYKGLYEGRCRLSACRLHSGKIRMNICSRYLDVASFGSLLVFSLFLFGS
jgi:hypothetical protein